MLASCTNAPGPAPAPSPRAQATFARLTNGMVAGPPVSCVPNYNTNDQGIIDGRTLSFRVGTGTLYIVRLSPGCENIGIGPYALLSRQYGGMGLCRGDIQQVIDTMAHITVGSCTVADIIPYRRP
jgi:hypothetical protein